jgi:hypothetical protein
MTFKRIWTTIPKKKYRSIKESPFKHFYMRFDRIRRETPKEQEHIIYDMLNRDFTIGHKLTIDGNKIQCHVTIPRNISELGFITLMKDATRIFSTDAGFLRMCVDTQLGKNRLPNKRYIASLKDSNGNYKNVVPIKSTHITQNPDNTAKSADIHQPTTGDDAVRRVSIPAEQLSPPQAEPLADTKEYDWLLDQIRAHHISCEVTSSPTTLADLWQFVQNLNPGWTHDGFMALIRRAHDDNYLGINNTTDMYWLVRAEEE